MKLRLRDIKKVAQENTELKLHTGITELDPYHFQNPTL